MNEERWEIEYNYFQKAGGAGEVVLVIGKGNFKSIADLKTKKNFMVVPDVDQYKTKDGIFICNTETFFKNIFLSCKISSCKSKIIF